MTPNQAKLVCNTSRGRTKQIASKKAALVWADPAQNEIGTVY